MGFADALAHTLEKRGCMLKLMSMNIYDMEVNSRLENLVAFKKAYADALQAVTCCLEKFFPVHDRGRYTELPLCFFSVPFLAYILTHRTRKKQLRAMEMAGVNYTQYSIYTLIKPFLVKNTTAFW